ncbi:hypothetical protein [Haloprofundus halobius]|uniref:hypothetical protein n=1 Tax=Haloprofundus halobius TaxID=2876194 RepID=UPI001CCE4E97|nr:hypothetical protein [Haloprofundus halobius]
MARELAVNKAEEKSTTDGDNDGLLLGRRSYLQMAGAAAAAVATGAGASGVATAAVSENNYDTVVNIADEGADTSGGSAINSILEEHLNDNTLVKFPEGTYRLSPLSVDGLENFAMVAPNGATIAPDHSGADTLLYFDEARGVHVEGFDVEQSGSTSSRVIFRAEAGTNVLKNWRLLDRQDEDAGGAYMQCKGSDTKLTFENVDFSKGGEGMAVWIRPTIVGDYPDSGEVPELDPAGTINFINCEMNAWDREGLYASAHAGKLNVIGGRYANNNLAQVRTGGEHAVVKGVEIVCDDPSATPRELNMRGIWMKEGHLTVIEDCDILMSDVSSSSGAVKHDTEAGKMIVRNTRIQTDTDVKGIKSKPPKDWPYRAPSMDSEPESRELVVENVSITGSADGDTAFYIVSRDGSSVSNLCIHQTGSDRDGIEAKRVNNFTLRDSTIDVTGDTTLFDSMDAATANITRSGSCPAPELDGKPAEYDGDSGRGDNDTDSDPNESELSNYLEVTGDGEYSFATSGEIANGGKANLDKEDTIDAQTASGEVAGGGADSYGFEGELNALEHADDVTVTVNGETVDQSDYSSISRPNVVQIRGDDGLASYEFTVDGELDVGPTSAGSINEEDNILGATAEGAVAGGSDAYSFSGSITQFRFTEGSATVLVNGEEVDPSELSSDDGSSDDGRGDTDGDADSSKHLEVTGDGEYTFTASGEITDGGEANLDKEDAIDAQTASGAVAGGGTDSYDFEGELETLEHGEDIVVTVDGEEVDPAEVGSDDGRGDTGGDDVERDSDYPHLLVINGPEDGVTNYVVSVTGDIKKTDIAGSINPEDEVDGNKASGAVAGGKDAYLFSGDITQFNLSGSASVDLQKEYQQE